MDYVHSLPGMEDLWFKIDEESEQAFKKMFVRYKKEIVHLGLEDNDFEIHGQACRGLLYRWCSL
ncbi:rhodanese-related sulfurtransferase [Streptococcus pneumoniae]|nr:rhodanese-related sulfurtransferase [Streptococcus pneumoniae]